MREELATQFRLHPVAKATEAKPANKLTQSGRSGGDDDGQCQQRNASLLSAGNGIDCLPEVEGREQLQAVRQQDGCHAEAEQTPVTPKARAQDLYSGPSSRGPLGRLKHRGVQLMRRRRAAPIRKSAIP